MKHKIFAIQDSNSLFDYFEFTRLKKSFQNKEIILNTNKVSLNSVFFKSTYICFDHELIDLNNALGDLGGSILIIFSPFDKSYKFPKEVSVTYSKSLNKESITEYILKVKDEYSITSEIDIKGIYEELKKYISYVPDEYLINSIHISVISGIPFKNLFSKSSKEYDIMLEFLDYFYQYLLNPISQGEEYYKCIKYWLSIKEIPRVQVLELSLQYLIKATTISDSTTDYFQKKLKQYDSLPDSKIMKLSIELSKLLTTLETSETLGIQKFLTNVASKTL